MELDMMEGLFDDFDIITQEEYCILYDNIWKKLTVGKAFERMLPIVNGLIADFPYPEDLPEDMKDEFMMQLIKSFMFLFVKDQLMTLVHDKNPSKKIYSMASHLYDMAGFIEEYNIEIKEKDRPMQNMLISLFMYIILYYRFRDQRIYKKYILPRLFDNFKDKVCTEEGLPELQKMIAALPPHDESEAELQRMKNMPEETVREELVKAHEKIRELEKRIVDLEGELNDAHVYNDMPEEGADDAGNGRFYKRKMQLGIIKYLLRAIGADITKNKAAASILISNLLHISNYKGVQKMLSDSQFYLRSADHGEACAEMNGILRELGSKLRVGVRVSKSAEKDIYPIKDYAELLKYYKETGK